MSNRSQSDEDSWADLFSPESDADGDPDYEDPYDDRSPRRSAAALLFGGLIGAAVVGMGVLAFSTAGSGASDASTSTTTVTESGTTVTGTGAVSTRVVVPPARTSVRTVQGPTVYRTVVVTTQGSVSKTVTATVTKPASSAPAKTVTTTVTKPGTTVTKPGPPSTKTITVQGPPRK